MARCHGGRTNVAAPSPGRIKSAIYSGQFARLAQAVHLALGIGVEGQGVEGVCVDAFYDVDLALDGPRLAAQSPEGGPGAADAAGHVFDVEDEEAVVVVFFALQTDALAANVASIGAI